MSLTAKIENSSRPKRKPNPNRGAKKGERRGGRQKGTPNKVTSKVKEALTVAFDEIGGVPALVSWGKENQTEFYKLWIKVMPTQTEITGADGAPLIPVIKDGI